MRRAYEHDWREFNALGVPTFQCQVESGMALEPQLESPEPYALNQPPQILLQFFDPGGGAPARSARGAAVQRQGWLFQ